MNKKIEETLNLQPIDELEETQDENGVTVYTTKDESVPSDTKERTEKECDMEFARQNLYDLISKGHGALDEIDAIAKSSQHPRAFEVYATMLKSLVDANKDLIEISERKNPEKKEEEKTVNNNHLYVGSTNDILKLLNDKKEESND